MSFENFVSQGPLAISPSRAKDIFENVIVPRFGVQGDPVENPTYVTIGGQPGSGKSTSIRQAQTGLQGATQKIIPDEAQTWLPGYSEQVAIDPAQASGWARQAKSSAFTYELAVRAVARRANVVEEWSSPLRSVRSSKAYQKKGYRSELHVIATPYSLSWTSILDRAENALARSGLGANAIVKLSTHETKYSNWPRAVFDAEDQKQYDRVVIKNRNGEILYENELLEDRDEPTWKKSPRALEALLAGRHRPLAPNEVETAQGTWKRVIESKHRPFYNDCAEHMSLETSQTKTMSDVQRKGRQVERNSKAVKDLKRLVTEDVDLCLSRSSNFYPSSPEFELRMKQYVNDISVGAERNNWVRIGHVLEGNIVSSFKKMLSAATGFLERPLSASQNGQRKPAAKLPSLGSVQEKDEKGWAAIGAPGSLPTMLEKPDLNKPPPLPKSPMLADAEGERIGAARGIRGLESEIEALQVKLAKTQGLSDISGTRQELRQDEALERGKKSISSKEQNTRAALKMPRTFDASRSLPSGHDR